MTKPHKCPNCDGTAQRDGKPCVSCDRGIVWEPAEAAIQGAPVPYVAPFEPAWPTSPAVPWLPPMMPHYVPWWERGVLTSPEPIWRIPLPGDGIIITCGSGAA